MHKQFVNTCLRCTSLSSLLRGCLYAMSWPAFSPGSAHVLFPHKMGVVFIYAVFPVPLGEIHLGDVSEANGQETRIYSWPTIRDPKRFGRAEDWSLGTWQRQDLIGLMINTKPTNGKT